MSVNFLVSNILCQLCLNVGQVGNLRPIVNRPIGGGNQPPRRMPSCPTLFEIEYLCALGKPVSYGFFALNPAISSTSVEPSGGVKVNSESGSGSSNLMP